VLGKDDFVAVQYKLFYVAVQHFFEKFSYPGPRATGNTWLCLLDKRVWLAAVGL
jgi:hypothetical protein